MNEPNSPPPQPYNPYVAPQNHGYYAPQQDARYGAPNASIAAGGIIKWFYLVATLGMPLNVLLSVVLIVVLDVPAEKASAVEGGIQGLIKLGSTVLGFVWIYVVWDALPRHVRGDTSPGGAVGALFIPFYNLIWMFQLNVQLCAGLDTLFNDREQKSPAPRTLAVMAPAVQVVSSIVTMFSTILKEPLPALIAAFVANVMWTIYMFRVDRARTLLAT